jgi:hypothetical protein
MSSLTVLGKVLHEEHFRILALICGLEHRVVGEAGETPLDPENPDEREALQALLVALDQIIDHNAFEEATLFPLICARGGRELTSLLMQEHITIGPLARQTREIAAAILDNGIDPARWQAFKTSALNLTTEMLAHLQKEEMTVVQRLPAFLDTDTDHHLAQKHLAERPPTRIRLAFQ